MLSEMVCSQCHEIKPCMIKDGQTLCLKCYKVVANVDETLGFPVIKKGLDNGRSTDMSKRKL